jgi:hypothetical protein
MLNVMKPKDSCDSFTNISRSFFIEIKSTASLSAFVSQQRQ